MEASAGAPSPGAAPKRAKLGKRPFPRDEEAGPSHAVHSAGPAGGRAGEKPPSVREMLRRCLALVGVAEMGADRATFLGLVKLGRLLPETDPRPHGEGEAAQPAPTLKRILAGKLTVGEGLVKYDDLEPLLRAWGAEAREGNPNSRKFAAFRRILARAMVVHRNICSFIEMEPWQHDQKRAAYEPDILPNWVGKAIPGSKYDPRRPKVRQRFLSPLDVALGNPRSFFRISVPRDGSEFLIRAYVYGCFGNFDYSLKLLEVETCDPDGKAVLAAVPWAWGPERRRLTRGDPGFTVSIWGVVGSRAMVTVKLRTPTGERLRSLPQLDYDEPFNLGVGEEMKRLYRQFLQEKASSSKAPLPRGDSSSACK